MRLRARCPPDSDGSAQEHKPLQPWYACIEAKRKMQNEVVISRISAVFQYWYLSRAKKYFIYTASHTITVIANSSVFSLLMLSYVTFTNVSPHCTLTIMKGLFNQVHFKAFKHLMLCLLLSSWCFHIFNSGQHFYIDWKELHFQAFHCHSAVH